MCSLVNRSAGPRFGYPEAIFLGIWALKQSWLGSMVGLAKAGKIYIQ